MAKEKDFVPNTQVNVPEGNFNTEIEWADTLIFEPIEKDFMLTPVLRDKIGKLALEGATNEEICLFCNIPTKAFRDYLKKNELFADWIKRLRTKTSFIARRNVASAINFGHLETSKWYLEKEERNAKNAEKCAGFNQLELLTEDDDAILEAYVTKTVTLKKTQRIPFIPIEEKIPEDN